MTLCVEHNNFCFKHVSNQTVLVIFHCMGKKHKKLSKTLKFTLWSKGKKYM